VSARRLYGDAFDVLWGELAPVPTENVEIVGDRVVGLDCFPSPGHAAHHVCYLHKDGTLYAGDAAGVRIQPAPIALPSARRRSSTSRPGSGPGGDRTASAERLALVHFGVAESTSEHLASLREHLTLWAERGREGLNQDAWAAAARRDLEAAVGERRGRPLGAGRPALAVHVGMKRYWDKQAAAAG
jgi:glyoxylase-like metal-dependent hydrolase (beta-lactamase superfamily II)